ncbi:MAG: hypothetical protein RL308_831 [Bacteroidota bacterium]
MRKWLNMYKIDSRNLKIDRLIYKIYEIKFNEIVANESEIKVYDYGIL